MQGVGFPETQDTLLKPVLKKMELLVIHLSIFCFAREGGEFSFPPLSSENRKGGKKNT
jgi:hypothetical protein